MPHLPPSWVSSLQRERTTNEAEEQSLNIWEEWRVWVPSCPQEEKCPVSCVLVLAHHPPPQAQPEVISNN